MATAKKNTRVVILDIGSGSVGGALVLIPDDFKQKPTILTTLRVTLKVGEVLDFDLFFKNILDATKIVCNKLSSTSYGTPAQVEVFLGSPWYVSSKREIEMAKNSPFYCNEKLLKSLIETDEKLFLDEKTKESKKDDQIEVLEHYIDRVRLNGYETKDFLGKQAKKINIDLFLSVAPVKVIEEMKKSIKAVFNLPTKFFSSLYSESFFMDKFTGEIDSFIFADFGAEITELSFFKDNIINQTATIPFGRNTLVRRYSSISGKSITEANSVLQLYFTEHMSETEKLQTVKILNQIADECSPNYIEVFKSLSKSFFLPDLIYEVSASKSISWLRDLFSRSEFTQFTLTGLPFNVTLLKRDGFEKYCDIIDSVSDPIFVTHAIFISANYKNKYMPKNILEDIKPLTSSGRVYEPESIEELPISIPKKKVSSDFGPKINVITDEQEEEIKSRSKMIDLSTPKKSSFAPVVNERQTFEKLPTTNSNKPKSKSRFMTWVIAVIILISAFFIISNLLTRADITIVPRSAVIQLDDTFSAKSNPNGEELSFSVIQVEGEESKSVVGSGKKDVVKPATGTVVIYNEFSAKSQPLVIDTRLLATDGKIYKTKQAVVVPGYTTKDGKVVPGQIETSIYSTEVGEAGNAKATNFKIFGFKGTPKYDKFYARSKGDISGGANGSYNVIEQVAWDEAYNGLEDALKAKLEKQAASQIPKDSIYFTDTKFFTSIPSVPVLESSEENIPVVKKGSMAIIFFDQQKLSNFILSKKLANYKGESVDAKNLKDMEVTLVSKASIVPKDSQAISFNIHGNLNAVYNVDKDKIVADLLGKLKNETELKPIVDKYQDSISKVFINIKPFWKMRIPKDANKINMIIEESK